MTAPKNAPLSTPPLPVQLKIAVAWTSFTLLYAYVDILGFYKPGVIDGILNGRIWEFDISPTLLTVFFVGVLPPVVMVMLSVVLPARVGRIANLVVAALLIPYSLFNAVGESWAWAGFYALSIGVELLLLAYILRTAWTWPRVGSRVDAADVEAARR